jgi:L-rhamnonate dehydratase
MKIGKITAWLLRVPYSMPLIQSRQHMECVFVEIETGDGVRGHAMASYPMKHGVREFINRDAAAIIGMNPLHTEAIRTRLIQATASKQVHGAWACAASLIDIALWDIKGKVLRQPIWALLGGARSEVPAYITCGFQHYSTEELIEVVKMMVNEGQTGIKMVVAAGQGEARVQATDDSIREDAARVGALRAAVGPKLEIMIDANKGATFNQALMLARLCEPYHLTWFEDAVQQSDPRVMAALRSKTTVPLAAGSTGTSDLMYLREYLLHQSVDYLQPNVRDLGGYTQAIKAAGLAQTFNVALGMGGGYPHLNMHFHAGVSNGGRVEYHWATWKCYEAVFEGTPVSVNGRVKLPTAPGLGFTPRAGVLDLAVD